jgi:hypothetical protein
MRRRFARAVVSAATLAATAAVAAPARVAVAGASGAPAAGAATTAPPAPETTAPPLQPGVTAPTSTPATTPPLPQPGVLTPATTAPPATPPAGSATTANPATPAGLTVDGPGGLDLTDAWKLSTGSPQVVVAYVEGGVNWHTSDAATQLANSVYVNWRELPIPCEGPTVVTATMEVGGRTEPCRPLAGNQASDYDLDGSGVINAAQWAHDPRVHDSNGNGVIDPEDLIAAFSCFDPRTDVIGTPSWPGGRLRCSNGEAAAEAGADDNALASDAAASSAGPATAMNSVGQRGFPHDISGWDFYDDQNDPATVDAAYDHSDDQMSLIHHICPGCLILPIKAGDESLDRTEDLANAWLYAAHEGARVIVSVTADLGYSSYMRQVIERLEKEGVVMVESSNDFDTPDHQGGMYWPYVLPGNGVVTNATGLPGSQAGLVPDRWTRSDETSWGPHNVVSVPTGGGSTSESTPTLGASIALVLSYGLQAQSQGLIHESLSGPRAEQVVESTATPVTDTGLPWPGSPGSWSSQYGYGIVDVYRAMQAVAENHVPPEAAISSPDWYSLWDPTRTRALAVEGHVLAPGEAFRWTLQAGLGPEPSGSSWFDIGHGSGYGGYEGALGTLELSRVPRSFWSAPFSLSGDKEQSSFFQYTVTLRLEVQAPDGQTGVDRRAIEVHHDSGLLAGFPQQLGSSGESPPVLADLQGSGHEDIVLGTADGLVKAIDPVTGRELPGWPAHTLPVQPRERVPGIDPGHVPILSSVAVASLSNDGRLSVVATDVEGHVYVFDAYGRLQPGWPKTTDDGVVPPPVPRPPITNVREPVQGALASPVLYALQGGSRLDVVQAGWDGEIHAWQPDGSPVPGWPVGVSPPPGLQLAPGHILEDDMKLESTPTIAFLDGASGGPDVVERAQFTEITGGGIQPSPIGFVFAFHADGSPVAGWPVQLGGLIEYYGSAQEFITEGTASPVSADVERNGADEVAVGPAWTPESLIGGSGQPVATYGSSQAALASLAQVDADPGVAITGPLPPDVPVPFTTDSAFGELGGQLVLAQPQTGAASLAAALVVDGSGNGINQYETAYAAAPPEGTAPGGALAELPGYPALRQGLDFLGEPVIAPVAPAGPGGPSGSCCIVDGGDSGALTAYTASGTMAPGFPKFSGGWTIASPSVGDLLGNGVEDLVTVTREGELFAWATRGSATADPSSWPRYRHDGWNTGRSGQDATPPGVIRDARFTKGGAQLTFVAPGSAWYDGQVKDYEVSFGPRGSDLVPSFAPAGGSQSIAVPRRAPWVTVQAVNAGGLLGRAVTLVTPPDRVSGPPGAPAAGPPRSRVSACNHALTHGKVRGCQRRSRSAT